MTTPDDDDADRAAFLAAMQGVQRHTPKRAPPSVAALTPQPRQTEADARAVIAELLDAPDLETLESGETLNYRAPGVQEGVLRKLRRGQFRIEKELDLHGLNRDKARDAVAHFLAYCHDQRLRSVRIIHGKGNGSPNSGPVIKTLLDGWLRRRKDVVAFCSARPTDGGSGAIYLLLRDIS